jgi:NAD(P)-dependent dehydrogenase (short-subunit alcohol dehydrogenase family)
MLLGAQRILVLGGTSGIGLTTAQLAAAEGATVITAGPF